MHFVFIALRNTQTFLDVIANDSEKLNTFSFACKVK